MSIVNSRPLRQPSPLQERNQFRWYQACVASYLVPHGLLNVLFPFLIVVYLGESPERVGQAEAAMLIPILGIVLIGGAIADRVDQRRLLMVLYAANLVPVMGLLFALWSEQLSYSIMLIFALASGTATAFMQPGLDAMLNHIAGANLQRSVTATVAFSYGMSLLGFTLGSTSDRFGVMPLLVVYIVLAATGIWASARLPAAPPVGDAERRHVLREIREGFRVVLHSRRMFPPAVLSFFGGLCLGGPYAVLVPLILRDVYGGSAGGIASGFTAFVLGGATSTMWFLRRGGVARPGRALVTGYLFSAVGLFVWSTHVPYWGFLMATYFWGFGGGMCISMGRTILLEAAPASHRARVMSINHLAGRQ